VVTKADFTDFMQEAQSVWWKSSLRGHFVICIFGCIRLISRINYGMRHLFGFFLNSGDLSINVLIATVVKV
jgi:hypothetical protein